MSLLTKTDQKLIDELELGLHPEVIANPFSGREVTLPPLGVALYDYIKGCEITGNYKMFDTARLLFAKLYPDEYMILLD